MSIHRAGLMIALCVVACSSGKDPQSTAAGANEASGGNAAVATAGASAGAAAPLGTGGMATANAGTGGGQAVQPTAGSSAPSTGGTGMGVAGMGVAGSAGTTAGASGGAAGAGGTSGVGGQAGAATPTMGGFPKTDEVNIKAKGPYKVMMYTDGLTDPEYSSSVMYYPGDAQPPFAAVALAPGYTASGTDYEFVGDMLASHGIAALLTTPTDTNADQPPARGDDLVAAVKHIMKENDRQGSPLQGKLAVDRICVTGQSMGGGGTLFAANKLGNMIRCALPMEPWQPGGSFPMISAPTLIVGAASDTIAAVSSNAQGHYDSIPNSVPKFLVVFQGDHYLSTDRTSGIPQGTPANATPSYDPQAAYMIPFYKLFLENDERYRPFLYDDAMRSKDMVTSYMLSKK